MNKRDPKLILIDLSRPCGVVGYVCVNPFQLSNQTRQKLFSFPLLQLFVRVESQKRRKQKLNQKIGNNKSAFIKKKGKIILHNFLRSGWQKNDRAESWFLAQAVPSTFTYSSSHILSPIGDNHIISTASDLNWLSNYFHCWMRKIFMLFLVVMNL